MGPVTSVTPGRVELRQSAPNVLGLPILIAVCLLAVIIRLLMPPGGSTVIIIVAAVLLVPDIVFALYMLRNRGSTLVVTASDITFTRGSPDAKRPQRPQVIQRTDGSKLSFRVARNGPLGGDYTAYILKLRDNATGNEVYAGAFGRRKVQQACESQGWSFA